MSEKIQFSINILGTEKEISQLNKLANEMQALADKQKVLKITGKQNTDEYRKTAIQLNETRKAYRQVTNSIERQNKVQIESKNTLRSVAAQLSILREKLKDVEIGGQAYKKMTSEIKTLEKTQKEANQAMGRGKFFVGEYGKAFTDSFARMAGAAILVNKAIQGIQGSFGTIVDFEKSMAKVRAISNATNTEFEKLNDLSRELGETTEYTASQVANLELQLAKLGFSTNQIVDMTGAILDLATATDEDLGQSSEVVGQTMRAFGLDAEQTGRVVDVMAKSFSSSALDLNKFSTAMAQVAPVANTFGFSVEETTALLAQLVNAGFDASTAGTALRNILLNLADSNGALAQKLGGSVNSAGELLDGLKKLDASGISLSETLELTDKRSVAAFNQFLQTADSAKELTATLYDAGGSAKEMATIMRDTLSGDLDVLASVMEGKVLAGGSAINGIFRAIVQTLTFLISNIDNLITGFFGYIAATKGAVLWTTLFAKGTAGAASGLTKMGGKISEFLSKNFFGLMAAGAAIVIKELISLWSQTSILSEALSEANEKVAESAAEFKILENRLSANKKGTDDYNQAIEELNSKLSAMGQETISATASSEELAAALKMVRKETENQIRLEVYRDKLKELIVAQTAFNEMVQGGGGGTSYKVAKKGLEDINGQIEELQNRIDGVTNSQNKLKTESSALNYEWGNLVDWNMGGEISKIEYAADNATKSLKDLKDATIDLSKEIDAIMNDNPSEVLLAYYEQEQERLRILEEALNAEIEMTDEYRNENNSKDQEQYDKDVDNYRKAQEGKRKDAEAFWLFVNEAAQKSSEVIGNFRDAELMKLQQNLELGVISEEEATEKKKKIQKNYALFELLTTTAKIVADTRAAIMTIWKTYAANPILAGILSGITAAKGVSELAKAKAEYNKVSKLSGGGLLKGNSHAAGGVYLGGGVEAEGGEAVINTRSTRLFAPVLSAINSYNGFGKPLKAAAGMVLPPSSPIASSSASMGLMGGVDMEKFANMIINGYNDKQVYVTEKDISDKQIKMNKIQTKVTF